MKCKTLLLFGALSLVPVTAAAVDPDLKAQIDATNNKIKTEEAANQKLKDDMSARDKEIADLKQKLKELEAQAAAAKPAKP